MQNIEKIDIFKLFFQIFLVAWFGAYVVYIGVISFVFSFGSAHKKSVCTPLKYIIVLFYVIDIV